LPRLLPAEWEEHEALWAAWPSHPELWGEDLDGARGEVTNFLRAVADIDPQTGAQRGEHIKLLVKGADAAASAHSHLDGLHIEILNCDFGDIWIRDSGPLFLACNDELRALGFRFNGWGGRYLLDGDEVLAATLAKFAHIPFERHFWTLEASALETDGEGVFLAQRPSLLDKKRNPGLNEETCRQKLCSALGARQVHFVDAVLEGDEVCSRLNGVVRFIGPNHLLMMKGQSNDDPNIKSFERLARNLEKARFNLSFIPSPGRVEDSDGEILPASFLYYIISNSSIIIPTYGTPYDDMALEAFKPLFPTRKVVGIRSDYLLMGGGSFLHMTIPQIRWPF
jgi:agmatine deiminase